MPFAEARSGVIVDQVKVELHVAPTLSWAAEHCGVPLIRGLRIAPMDGEAFPGGELKLELQPDLGTPKSIPIPLIPVGESFVLDRLDYRLPAGRLRTVVEAESADLTWSLAHQGGIATSGSIPVEVLPCHHWPGSKTPPALLASFVLPNHPVIGQILRRVADRLREASVTVTIDGYQSRSPRIARAQVMALYEVIQGLKLGYIGVPASFETTGQKVRLPDMILQDRLANCLDITLLAAACLEQMGLHPLLVLIEGHAFPGVWLVDERFPEGLVEDTARLRTLIALDQVLIWDGTVNMQEPPVPIGIAEHKAFTHLEDESRFAYALDVHVVRGERFLPLPIRDVATQTSEAGSSDLESPANADQLRQILEEAAREAARQPVPALVAPSQSLVNRFQKWKERLLDLSLRNRLLNFKLSGNAALPLEVPDIPAFEDVLAEGREFSLLPKPSQDSRDERDLRLLVLRDDAGEWRFRRLQDQASGTLHSPVPVGEFWSRASSLDRQAQTDLEEGGAATLFAVVGILKWYETPTAEEPRYAPLLLYPVRLLFDRKLRRVKLRREAEDAMPNLTLAEKMRRDYGVDFGFLATMEPDDFGLDIPQLLRLSREAIQRMPRWEIVEEVHLGHFTFTKFLMWKDLEDNAEALMRSAVVQHLARAEDGVFPNQPAATPVEVLDQQNPAELSCVMDADSTQLSAVASAIEGRNFVLQGPPGTGKSQTITNLIACALALGRSVLFVSEKMAALEVVYSRLRMVGLGDFCLELHSHKSNKKQVLDSFRQVVERSDRLGTVDVESRAAELQSLRKELNAYAQALHRPRPLGVSLYEGASRALELRRASDVILGLKGLEVLGREAFQAMRVSVSTFINRAQNVEPISANPWQGTTPNPWSHESEEHLRETLERTSQALDRLQRAARATIASLGSGVPTTLESVKAISSTLDVTVEGPLPAIALDTVAWAQVRLEAEGYSADRKALDQRRAALTQRWKHEIWSMELGGLHAVYQRQAHAFPLLRFFTLWGARKQLVSLATSSLPEPPQVLLDLWEILDVKKAEAKLRANMASLSKRLAPASGQEFDQLSDRVDRLEHHLGHLSDDSFRQGLVRQLGQEQLRVVREELTAALAEFATLEDQLGRLLGLTGHSNWAAWHQDEYESSLNFRIQNWAANLRTYRSWCHYREAAGSLTAVGLGALVTAHEHDRVSSDHMMESFEKALFTGWVAAIQDQEPAIRDFDGTHHHAQVRSFREIDGRWKELSRKVVIRSLESRLPVVGTAVAESSELGNLLREIRKKTRHMAVRKLFQSIPRLLPRLKPCLLMSPLSVAQYLPADSDPLDLIVFDEASQICTHDAIGALARGRQVVIVGDSRQLPPTSFFTRNQEEESAPDENDVVELESILDEAVAKQIPEQWLGWHYRSRHETLIDFSNQRYYENRLNVFPAAARQVAGLGVSWHPVSDGVYYGSGCKDRRKERTNPVEAERLVAHLVNSLRQSTPEDRSFGVVTFSMSQQRFIQELLDEQRALFPEIEAHWQGSEPPFVKNLENVQGDERDEILFSIGYARDDQGRLRLHFGPLSNAGGERRLNVAVTRARKQMQVFSTLTHDQIDLNRTKSVGAAHLKEFLHYVAQRDTALAQVPPPRFAGGFEREIYDAVKQMGFEVHTQIGCGQYRVDLAVTDPQEPGRYLLGIECDGQPYAKVPTARDRDRLRQEVLEGLGWRLHRIWSTDWWFEKEREIRRLTEALERAKTASPIEPKVAKATIPICEVSKVADVPIAYRAEPITLPGNEGRLFIRARLEPVITLSTEDFFAFGADAVLMEQIHKVVAIEAPLHLDDLARHLLTAWGWARLTDRGRQRVLTLVRTMVRKGELQLRGTFIWLPSQPPEAFLGYRTPVEGDESRDVERIPPEEVAEAMRMVLHQNISLELEDLLRETARRFGYRRVTPKTIDGIAPGIEVLIQRGICEVEGQRVSLR